MSNFKFTLILLAIFTFLVVFWPTLYRYETLTVDGNIIPVRSNRLTGKTEIFALTKWVSETEDKKPIELSQANLMKITGNADLKNGYLEGSLYNGSNFELTSLEITIELTSYGSIDELKDGSLSTLLSYVSQEFSGFSSTRKQEFESLIASNSGDLFEKIIEIEIPSILKLPKETRENFSKEFLEAVDKAEIPSVLRKYSIEIPKAGWARRFAILKNIPPLTTTSFSIEALTSKGEKFSNFNWQITGAKGFIR